MKILFAITSYSVDKASYLNKVLDGYSKLDADVTVALSTSYEFDYSGSLNIIRIPPHPKRTWFQTWACHDYLFSNYQNYDLVGSSDDDIFFSNANLSYFVNQNLPNDYLAGYLHYENDNNGNKRLISVWPLIQPNPLKRVIINGKEYRMPAGFHSAFFIADKNRFALAVEKGMTSIPKSAITKGKEYCKCLIDLPSMSRSEIYTELKKVVDIEDVRCLIQHLPNNYWIKSSLRIPTLEEAKLK